MASRRYLYVLFLLSLCINSAALAHENPINAAWRTVQNAHNNWDEAKDHLQDLKIVKGDLESALALVESEESDNNEDHLENFTDILGAISADPADVLTDAVKASINAAKDIWDTFSLSVKKEKVNQWISTVDADIVTYNANVLQLKGYYKTLFTAFEHTYGPVDTNTNAPLLLAPPNYCVRSADCNGLPISSPDDSENHQINCPEKIEGGFFGGGERTCDGHLYSCDEGYKCPKNLEHLMDSSCPHPRIKVGEKDDHEMKMGNGPCNQSDHDYYACDETHGLVENCSFYKYFNVWDVDTYRVRRVYCNNQSSYYRCTQHQHRYPTRDSAGNSYYSY